MSWKMTEPEWIDEYGYISDDPESIAAAIDGERITVHVWSTDPVPAADHWFGQWLKRWRDA